MDNGSGYSRTRQHPGHGVSRGKDEPGLDGPLVQTWFIFSSADPVTGMLTSPRVARPIVHLFTFILISFRLFGFTFVSCSSAIRPPVGAPPFEPSCALCIVHRAD